ncbi:MAG TPA: alpha/beta fold hydrolase [Verrucomicrobiae bacterium]|nr:alpha/beta fold hydrolase [Verrucomicrobiae bacterium]
MTAARADFDLVQTGRGPDLLLLHSLLTDRTVFDPIVPRLARSRRVTALNLPGFGASTPAGPRIEDYADRVAELFAVLPLAGADVVAMSFGGFVATALAARHGTRIRRLALVDTAAAFPEEARAPLRGMAERALAAGMDAVVDTAVRRMFTDAFIAARPEVIERQTAVLRRARPEAFATACRALAALDLRPALAAIANPTLVVVGTLDVTTPPALARELAAGIRGATLVEIPACAHCPPIEKPAELLTALEPFLDAPVPR